uniref:Hypotheticial protein n=1 Tax=Schistosoma japonicum TaxID=6182 RepID=C7TYV0_SCHJA|nr:hypotheticial protein [Schistosoma japonicum]CAX82821.1 hypotheticial protein [Schistosoma japonicum]
MQNKIENTWKSGVKEKSIVLCQNTETEKTQNNSTGILKQLGENWCLYRR